MRQRHSRVGCRGVGARLRGRGEGEVYVRFGHSRGYFLKRTGVGPGHAWDPLCDAPRGRPKRAPVTGPQRYRRKEYQERVTGPDVDDEVIIKALHRQKILFFHTRGPKCPRQESADGGSRFSTTTRWCPTGAAPENSPGGKRPWREYCRTSYYNCTRDAQCIYVGRDSSGVADGTSAPEGMPWGAFSRTTL